MFGGFSIALGSLTYAKKVIYSVGTKITTLPHVFLNHYKVSELNENNIVITTDSKIKEGITDQIYINLKGNEKGNYILNRDTRIIERANIQRTINASLTANKHKSGGLAPPRIQLNIESKIKIKGYIK